MSGKNQYPNTFNWQTTDPRTGFLPNPNQYGSIPSGIVTGSFTGSETIYSNILDISKMDNQGLEVAFSGTGTGTLSIYGNNSGIAANFFALTFNPALVQPTGSSLVYGINLNQFPWKYVLLIYVNASGTGTLTIYGQNKDLN